jgi:hypothetical protein
MAEYKDIEAYRRAWERRIKALEKEKKRGPRQAASYMKNLAKKYAPRGTGETLNSITSYKYKKGYIVESLVFGFPQNVFANRQGRFKRLRFKETSKQPFYAIPQVVVYGKPAISPSGKPIKWSTQMTPFWDLAANKTISKHKRLMIRNIKKAWKTK